MSINEAIDEHEQLRIHTSREASKSYPVIVSQSSFERDVINNVHRMTINDRQLSAEKRQFSFEMDDDNQIRDSNYNIGGETKIDGKFFSRSMTSPGSSPKPLPPSSALAQSPNTNRQSVITHSGLTKPLKNRIRMRRQDKIDEDDTRGLYASQSFDTANLHKSREQFNMSHSHYSSFDNNIVARRYQEQPTQPPHINIKSKSLDLYNEFRPFDPLLQFRPFHSSASDSISSRSSEDDVQIRVNSPNITPVNVNSPSMYFHQPYFNDMFTKNESPHTPHTAPIDARIVDTPFKVSGSPASIPDSPISQDVAQYKALKYTKRGFSLNTHPYDRINAFNKSLRRIYSEEFIPPLDSKGGKMRRSSSYNTLKDLNRNNKPTQKQDIKQSNSKMIFPDDNNVSAYRDVFIKHDSKQKESPQLFQKDSDFLNYLNNFKFQVLEEDKSKQQKTSGKQKTNKTTDASLIPPYVYDRQVDDELAVCVTGLLTLPGSNEKRYPITVGELRRRISPPEYLNKVDMISYVRHAKTTARELLEKHAIRPKHHCRKSKHSIISKMCEAECSELAKGLKKLSEEYFPYDWVARKSLEVVPDENRHREKEKEEKLKKIESARLVLRDLASVLGDCKSNSAMQDYNLATHTYGIMDLTNNISLIDNILEKQMDILGCNSSNSTTTSWSNLQQPDSSAPMNINTETINMDT